MIDLRDERGIIVGWIVKLIMSLAIFGVVAFEAGAIIVATVTVDRIAVDAAQEAGLEYGRTGSSKKARTAATELAERNGAALVAFSLGPDRETVEVTIEKRATTIVAGRIGALDGLTTTEATHTGRVR